jgi:hypothetical protein
MANRVQSLYQWDAVAGSYMRLCEGQDADYEPKPLAEKFDQLERRGLTLVKSPESIQEPQIDPETVGVCT